MIEPPLKVSACKYSINQEYKWFINKKLRNDLNLDKWCLWILSTLIYGDHSVLWLYETICQTLNIMISKPIVIESVLLHYKKINKNWIV